MSTLSIIILSYNTSEITKKCIEALMSSLHSSSHFSSEIIVVDNASGDGSPEMLQNLKQTSETENIKLKIILNSENEGYPKGNNRGIRESDGEFILFLNSDAIVENVHWQDLIEYMHNHRDVGALTVKVHLPSGSIDPASHRGFPTIWNAFSYYSGLEKLTQSIPVFNQLFGGYHLKHQSLQKTHEIDSPSGAFYLTRRNIIEKLKGFDETFFMYGEDLDLSFRIKENGFKVIYYPHYTVLHMKYQSGLQTKTVQTQQKTKGYFYDAMKIFYQKHYAKQNPGFVNSLVNYFINLKARL